MFVHTYSQRDYQKRIRKICLSFLVGLGATTNVVVDDSARDMPADSYWFCVNLREYVYWKAARLILPSDFSGSCSPVSHSFRSARVHIIYVMGDILMCIYYWMFAKCVCVLMVRFALSSMVAWPPIRLMVSGCARCLTALTSPTLPIAQWSVSH